MAGQPLQGGPSFTMRRQRHRGQKQPLWGGGKRPIPPSSSALPTCWGRLCPLPVAASPAPSRLGTRPGRRGRPSPPLPSPAPGPGSAPQPGSGPCQPRPASAPQSPGGGGGLPGPGCHPLAGPPVLGGLRRESPSGSTALADPQPGSPQGGGHTLTPAGGAAGRRCRGPVGRAAWPLVPGRLHQPVLPRGAPRPVRAQSQPASSPVQGRREGAVTEPPPPAQAVRQAGVGSSCAESPTRRQTLVAAAAPPPRYTATGAGIVIPTPAQATELHQPP